MKSGNINILEHSGPQEACNGTTLPFKCTAMAEKTLAKFRNLSLYFTPYSVICKNYFDKNAV